MQPAPTSIQPPMGIQLSLMPDQVPAPPADLIGSLPETVAGEAITVLAGMIAQVAQPLIAEAGDE